MDDLAPLVADWPVGSAVLAVTDASDIRGATGDLDCVIGIASVSKIVVGLAGLVAIEEGTIDLDEPAGPPGSTVRHLLAHASGLGFEEDRPRFPPGTRRLYSNPGIEWFADHLAARARMPFVEYLTEGVLQPLAMTSTKLVGTPAHGIHSSTGDLLAFARELLAPTLVSPRTLATATTTQFPDLAGVVPGVRHYDPCPWGLTFEIRGDKQPHWTGTTNSERTFGHFGGSGTFLWVDPVAGLAVVALTDRRFGPWALKAWPEASDRILAKYDDSARDQSGRAVKP
ncbi:MAG: beta-lactamase family protein [Actinomycetota bacterium]|nr:beta-lactamase family protein [Actinomycetota bacterium]